MTIARVNGSGWGVGDKLTSAQGNALDINVTNALDKRAAQTDALASVVSLTGAGRVIRTAVVGANGATTYQVDQGNLLVHVTSAVTANCVYSVNTTNAVAGDEMTFYCDSTFTFEVQIKSPIGGTLLYTLGNLASSDGSYCTLCYSGTAWQLETNQGARLRSQVFTANGTFNVPQGVSQVFLFGWGAGGGGGGGSPGQVAANVAAVGASGGAGAIASYATCAVTPGGTAAVGIGTAGSGGGGGSVGGSGGNTTFAGTTTITFQGAQGGQTYNGTTSTTKVVWPASPTFSPVPTQNYVAALFVNTTPSSGGSGTDTTGTAGNTSPQGFAGGTAGTIGANSGGGTHFGGGSGGGGGGGPLGAGGNGGSGGIGSDGSGAASTGGIGNAPGIANSGAGGGGGGGSGCSASASAAGPAGGNGAAGMLTVFFVK